MWLSRLKNFPILHAVACSMCVVSTPSEFKYKKNVSPSEGKKKRKEQ